MRKISLLISAAIFGIGGLFANSSVFAAGYVLSYGGTKACAAARGGSGTIDTTYGVHNYTPSTTMYIKGIRLYDANANLVYNSATDGFVGGLNTTLLGHMSTKFSVSSLISAGSGTWTAGPGEVEIDWRTKGAALVIPLGIGGTKQIIDGTTAAVLSERTIRCRIIPY